MAAAPAFNPSDGLPTAMPGELRLMWLEGSLETSDAADPPAVEKVLHASQDGAERAIAWKHVDARQHRFTVQGIERTAAMGE